MHLDEIIIVPLILIIALKLVPSMGIPILGSSTATPTPTVSGTLPTTGPGTPTITPTPNTPATATPTPRQCPTTSTRTYITCHMSGPATSPPAADHYDLNLGKRGYNLYTSGVKDFINLTPQADDDPNAPQLYYLLNKNPVFNSLYKVGRAPWDPPTLPYEVHLVGLAANPNTDTIHIPKQTIPGLSCSNKQVVVLYADQNNITLKYTAHDSVELGYTVHIADFCVDPNLLALYQTQNASGRSALPGLDANEILGTPKTNEVKVAIRDSGRFMDPRSKKDWWQKP